MLVRGANGQARELCPQGLKKKLLSCEGFFATPWSEDPPASCVHGIPQVRILERVAISFSEDLPKPGDQTWVSCIASGLFTI